MNNIEVGDLIKVHYGVSSFWGNYWKSRNLGIPATINGTRISDVDDDMRTTHIPDGTIMPVLNIRTFETVEEEGSSSFQVFFVLDPNGQLLWVDDVFAEKCQPEPEEAE